MPASVDRKYWFDGVILLGFVVLHYLVFAVTNWDTDTSLLGVKSVHFGRYYSAKTIHAYELGLDPSRVPEYWNSIGETIPFEEENLIQNTPYDKTGESFFIDNRFIQTMRVFINTKQTIEQDTELQTCNHILNGRGKPTPHANQPSIVGIHPKCSLEHLHTVGLVTNGNSASILSEVTPGVYFTTLLIIYLLSMVQWVSVGVPRLLAPIIEKLSNKNPGETHKQASYFLRVVLYGFIIVWYSVMMLFAFTGINSMNFSRILKGKDAMDKEFMYNVYFRVVSHLPSLMLNLFAILLYALHLRGRHLAFGYYWGEYQVVKTEAPRSVAAPFTPAPDTDWKQPTMPHAALFHNSNRAQPDNFHDADRDNTNDFGSAVNMKPMLGFPMHNLNLQMPQLHQSMHTGAGNGFYFGHTGDSGGAKLPHSNTNPVVGCFERGSNIVQETLACTHYKSLGALEDWSRNHRTGTKYYGPVTSEASVLLANTIVLGGIGCAAIGKGMTLEIELQMLVIAVVSFAVLEIGIQKVHNYYLYVAEFHSQVEHHWGRMFFIAFSVVRFVVLVLQGIILTLWMNTMNNIGSSSQTLFMTIFVMTLLYYIFRLIILLLEVLEQSIIATLHSDHPHKANARKSWRFAIEIAHFVIEFVWGVFLFFIVISVIYSMTIGVRNLQDSNEAMVLRFDKKLYGHMRGELQKDIDVNEKCDHNFQDTSLLAKQMNTNNFDDDKFMKDLKDIEAAYLKPGEGGMFGLSAIDLKTYYWSRRWRQGTMSMGPLNTPGTVNPDIFFCSAGFERHWGICQNYYTDKSLPKDVSEEILKTMRYYETTAVDNPEDTGKTLVTRTEWNDGAEVVPVAAK